MTPRNSHTFRYRRTTFEVVVGVAAITAPIVHSLSDAIEWLQGGFSGGQLWLSYVALLYGVAFTYFAHTALVALAERTPTYEALWQRLGPPYTVHGALMVIGGLLFSWSVLRAGWLPRSAIVLFASGLLVNLILAFSSAPEILQTIGTAFHNLALVWMGIAILLPDSKPRL
jgi:hypothetical protein